MDARNILLKVLQTIATDQKYTDSDIDIQPITSGGANYTSALFLATISSAGNEKLFAKVAIISPEVRAFMNGDRIFNTERFFYTELRHDYESIQDKHGVPAEERLVFPKFYGHSGVYLEETIVLENLMMSGYTSYNRFETITWEYASEAVKQMAKLHALSFACQAEEPEKFEKILEERKFAMPDRPKEGSPFLKMLQTAYQAVRPENRERLHKYLEGLDEKSFKEYYSPRGKATLVHGDYRPSNLMCRKTEDKLEIMPLDYQTIHAGCPAHDLLYFIFIGSDRAFRERHYQQLIDHYYQQMELFLQKLGQNLAKIYPRDQFRQELKDALPYGLIVAVFILPLMTVEEENAPKLHKDLEFAAINSTELYEKRFNGILDDLIDWGVL